MKICKRCGEVNEDENLLCKNGDCLNKEFEDYEALKNKAKNNLIRKEKLKSTFRKGYFYYIFSRRFNCRYNKL